MTSQRDAIAQAQWVVIWPEGMPEDAKPWAQAAIETANPLVRAAERQRLRRAVEALTWWTWESGTRAGDDAVFVADVLALLDEDGAA